MFFKKSQLAISLAFTLGLVGCGGGDKAAVVEPVVAM